MFTSTISRFLTITLAIGIACVASAAPFELLTGVDAGKYPGTARLVVPIPGGGFPNYFMDGDRLAGSADVGPTITWQGAGTPLRQPNDVGAMSFIFRRGTIPAGPGNVIPFMGIEALGGALIDMDGDAENAGRSLIPVSGQTPVDLPGTFSHIDFAVDLNGGTITLTDFEATGTNEGGPGASPAVGLTVNSIAGTTPTGGKTAGINGHDTRVGTLTAFAGTDLSLTTVFRIDDLKFEFWNDASDPGSSSPNQLGTIQQFVNARGWLVYRDPTTGQFPTLTGKGLGSTRWGVLATSVASSATGSVHNTAVTLQGPTATITAGNVRDSYSVAPAGVAFAGGDLGAYLDTVVAPRVSAQSAAYVFIESAGFGTNNSFDPVFTDTISYDLVLVAQERAAAGDINADGVVNGVDRALFVDILLNPNSHAADQRFRADVNGDGDVDGQDIAAFLAVTL